MQEMTQRGEKKMAENSTICPLRLARSNDLSKSRCIEKKCSWYVSEYTHPDKWKFKCAIAAIADNIESLEL